MDKYNTLQKNCLLSCRGSGDNVVHLTPEMVRAQFATIDVNCLPEEEIQVKESKER